MTSVNLNHFLKGLFSSTVKQWGLGPQQVNLRVRGDNLISNSICLSLNPVALHLVIVASVNPKVFDDRYTNFLRAKNRYVIAPIEHFTLMLCIRKESCIV